MSVFRTISAARNLSALHAALGGTRASIHLRIAIVAARVAKWALPQKYKSRWHSSSDIPSLRIPRSSAFDGNAIWPRRPNLDPSCVLFCGILSALVASAARRSMHETFRVTRKLKSHWLLSTDAWAIRKLLARDKLALSSIYVFMAKETTGKFLKNISFIM